MLLALIPAAVMANVPLFSDFDFDVINTPPATGGAHQPTTLVVPAGGWALVRSAPFGFVKPVELFDDDGEYVSVNYSFDPVNAGTKRFEATISLGELTTTILMQTSSSSGPIATRINANFVGEIWAGGSMVGQYQAGVPFRVRMDVQPGSQTFDITIDNQMNGFADDATAAGLPFIQAGVFDVANAHLSHSHVVGPITRVMYDDVYLGPESIGVEYCQAIPNSTGFAATLDVIGSDVVAHDYLTLESRQLPPNQFGYFIASQSKGFTANPGGSAGNLCLSGNIGRFNKQIRFSGPQGAFGITVDMANIPTAPSSAILAGSVWNFQSWYRDGFSSNFSEPEEVIFQ